MKTLTSLLLLLTIFSVDTFATVDVQYIIYQQHHYTQGFLKDEQKLQYPGNAFLIPEFFTEMFGSSENIYTKILRKLAEKKPEIYRQARHNSGDHSSDTIFFSVNEINDEDWQTLKNELTASVLANGDAEYIRINRGNMEYIFDKTDISIPYYSLGNNIDTAPDREISDTIVRTDTALTIDDEPVLKMYEPYLNLPLWISIALNIILIIYIIIRSRPV